MPKVVHGKSLAQILHDPKETVRDTALSINNRPGGSVRSATWHYIKYGENGEEFYDMTKDPHQYTNLVNDPDYTNVLKDARKKFLKRINAAR